MNLHGHYWTIAPVIQSALAGVQTPSSVAWSTELVDPKIGRVRLTGRLSDSSRPSRARSAREQSLLTIFVHGLGGSAQRAYMRRAALAASSEGVASLRLNLRGADLSGDDIHHAGLVEDLTATLASPALDRFDRIVLFGFSLGGHVCLRYAALDPDPRIRAVAALCSPLDLGASADAFDADRWSVYRPYVLHALRSIHAATAARGRAVIPARATRSVRRIRAWDDLVVTSRFGFGSADEYYRTMSVAPLLGRMKVPALYVGSDLDPMVPKAVVAPFLDGIGALDVRWLARGGHIGFPADASLSAAGTDGEPSGVVREALRWLISRA